MGKFIHLPSTLLGAACQCRVPTEVVGKYLLHQGWSRSAFRDAVLHTRL